MFTSWFQKREQQHGTSAEIARQQADTLGQINAIEKSQAVIHFDMDGTILKANDLFLKTLDYRLDDIVGQHHSLFAGPAVAASPEYRQFWEKLNRGEFHSGEYKRYGKNGKEVWLQATYNPIIGPDGKPFKVVKYATDVTASKLENADYLGQIEAINRSQAVVQFNMDGTLISANDLFLKTMGYTLDEIQGKPHRLFVEPDEAESAEYRQFWQNLNQGQFDSGEYKRIGKGGKTVWLQASYNPILDLNGKPFKVVKYAADITAEKNQATQTLAQIFSEVSNVMNQMSSGDLTHKITGQYDGIYQDCKNAINDTLDKLSEIFSQINQSAEIINNTSKEIASGNNNLSHRAEQQAANLQETAASMEELTATVKKNADNAQEANKVAENAKTLAEKGGDVVKAAIDAMAEINASSNKIADIISVIDEIAFQTNLLALNASVEAARAGDQGRGFSVVASEVRNLAKRSATAARESKELIHNSMQKVRTGRDFVNQTGTALNDIVDSVKKVGDLISMIASASAEQSSGISQINQAVTQMDELTQQNAALAEEASAASVSMSDLSSNMIEQLAFFKLHDTPPPRPAANPHPKPRASAKPEPRTSSYQSPASDEEWLDF